MHLPAHFKLGSQMVSLKVIMSHKQTNFLMDSPVPVILVIQVTSSLELELRWFQTGGVPRLLAETNKQILSGENAIIFGDKSLLQISFQIKYPEHRKKNQGFKEIINLSEN